jgi:hypothetical protein
MNKGVMPMKRLVVVTLMISLIPVPAHADHKKNAWCHQTGDYCTSTQKVKGKRKLQLRSFVHTGKVKICVTAPDDSQVCKRAKLRKNNHDIYVGSKNWAKVYPDGGPGAYDVVFRWRGNKLGPTLGFHA